MEPLKADYGDAVMINYYDVTDDNVDPELKEYIAQHNFPFPLTFINDKAVSAGFISFYDIATKVDDIFRELTS